MLRPRLARLTALAVPLALVLCALAVTPAWADDGLPPAEPPEPVLEGETPAQPADESLPEEPAAPGEPSTAELLAAAPEGTITLVVSEGGEALPLTTLEAAEVIALADPIWCPASVSVPVANASGCTASYSSLQALIDYLTANQPAVDGVIWIEKTYDSSAADPAITVFTLDGSALTTMAAYRLTVRGGWNGPATGTIDVSDPSELNAALRILNWQNDVTLTDLLLTGASVGGPTLQVTTTGRIVLTRVAVEANAGGGAELSNTGGTADVVITLSRFNSNAGGGGLSVSSRGQITLAGVLANGNSGHGAYLDNTSAPAARNITLTTGTFEFNDNGSHGLLAYSRGAITLRDLTATGNGGSGASLDNTAGSGAGVSLAGVNVFAENSADGLQIYSSGPIAASNLVANANGALGARLNNSGAASAQNVTLTGASQFKYNGSGLEVRSLGAITLANLTVSNSQAGPGAYLRNDYPGASANVSLTGVNAFNDNRSSGLEIFSNGAISLSNVTASRNGGGGHGYGAYLGNIGAPAARPVTLSGVNTFEHNRQTGLWLVSRGAVSLSNLTASFSVASGGAYVDNTYGDPASPQNVTLSGYGRFVGNAQAGLTAYSYGAISISNLTANVNGHSGGGGGGAYLGNGGGTSPRPVTVSGTNETGDNNGDGLSVYSFGAITVNSLSAWYNAGNGAYLNNAGGAAPVTLNGTSEFWLNGQSGLVVYSRGAITIKDFSAVGNDGYGALLQNSYSGVAANVSVGTGRSNWTNSLSSNLYTGLQVVSYGAVSLSNVSANGNGDPGGPSPWGYGVFVDNASAAAPRPVSLAGSNWFIGNYSGGLYVTSRGPITGSNLTASGTVHGHGAMLVNTTSGPEAPQNVTLTGVNTFAGNYNSGLEVWTYGAIALSNLRTENNGQTGPWGYGAYLNNASGATLPRNVSLSGWSAFDGNRDTGLWIQSLGAITLSSISASDNGGNGARLQNDLAGASGGITLSGVNSFAGNGGLGLWASSYGALSVSNVAAFSNFSTGVWLDNISAPAFRPVSVGGTSNRFVDNGDLGLNITTRGAVTLSSITASMNAADGVRVNNIASGAAAPQNVSLSGVSRFDHNGSTGLAVYTYGAIVASNVTASSNGVRGAFLDNASGAASARPITLSGVNLFEHNGWQGLYAQSLGAIAVSNATARWNGNDGLLLDNRLSGATAGVTLSGASLFEGNDGFGVQVLSYGPITLSNVTARTNLAGGAYLMTWGAATPQKVTLTGANAFTDNGDTFLATGHGLWVLADGPIAVSNLTASGNAQSGAMLDNLTYYASGAPGITLSGACTFVNNGGDGLFFMTMGAATLSKVVADGNGQDGVDGLAHGSITITTGSLTANSGTGLKLWTPAVATLKGVFAYGNGLNTDYSGVGTLKIYRS